MKPASHHVYPIVFPLTLFIVMAAITCNKPEELILDRNLVQIGLSYDGTKLWKKNDSVTVTVRISFARFAESVSLHYGGNAEIKKRIETNTINTVSTDFKVAFDTPGKKPLRASVRLKQYPDEPDPVIKSTKIDSVEIGMKPEILNGRVLKKSGKEIQDSLFSLRVEVDAYGTVSYSWFKDDVELPDERTQKLEFKALKLSDKGDYYCVVSSSKWGSDASLDYTLNVTALPVAPRIIKNPQDIAVTADSAARFIVEAAGVDLRYQWQRNRLDIPDAKEPIHIIKSAAMSDNGAKFRCIVSNDVGTATSTEALLQVVMADIPPAIVEHPQDITANTGDTVRFAVKAIGTNLRYQWKRNDASIPDAMDPGYEIAPVTDKDNGAKFCCAVYNAAKSVTSNNAVLTLNEIQPVITRPPRDTQAMVGEKAVFDIAATGTNLQYQWLKNGDTIQDAREGRYETPPVTMNDNQAKFRCVVSNKAGTLTSNEATLTVKENTEIPKITKHPVDATADEGSDVNLSVTATGKDVRYRWQENKTAMPGETTAAVVVPKISKEKDGFLYRCIVWNTLGADTSREAKITVNSGGAAENNTDITINIPVQLKNRSPIPR